MPATLTQRAAMAADLALRDRMMAALAVVAVQVARDNPVNPYPATGTNEELASNAARSRRRTYVNEVIADPTTQATRALLVLAGTDAPAVDAYTADPGGATQVSDGQLVTAVRAIWDTLAAAL